jgi:general secretion pathway protein A
MFLEHFGLIEQPFGVTPDPRFLHLGPKHREALASLIYGTENHRGFLALIAPPGMGKTSLLFQYLEGLRNKARAAFLFQTDCDPREFMRHLLTDLGVDAAGLDPAGMHEALNRILLEQQRARQPFVLVIDEAQNLSEKVLESVRLLSNFETPWMKLMQIVIAGQPQLAERLARPSMAQLRQRISSIIRLEPFTPDETNAYIDHRLWVAGYAGPALFTVGARLLIAERSQGIPRNINNLCFNSMSVAYAMDAKQVDSKMVHEAVSDLEIESLASAAQEESRGEKSHRIFNSFDSPFSSMIPARKTRRSARVVPAVVSAAAVLLLGIASGISWNRGMRTPPLELLPTVEAAVLPKAIAPPELALPATAAQMASEGPGAIASSASKPKPLEIVHAWSAAQEGGVRRRIFTVTAGKQDTLRHLSLQYLGKFDAATLAAIVALNPEITDPDHIEAGQRLRFPISIRRENPGEATAALQPAPVVSSERKP